MAAPNEFYPNHLETPELRAALIDFVTAKQCPGAVDWGTKPLRWRRMQRFLAVECFRLGQAREAAVITILARRPML